MHVREINQSNIKYSVGFSVGCKTTSYSHFKHIFKILRYAMVCDFNDMVWDFKAMLWDLYVIIWKIEMDGLICYT